ncbi:MAG: AI-2E family transporter [Elusimicrobia bacterium]|nr:AI-2E family transporter [Elusimicrobiota bacterium]
MNFEPLSVARKISYGLFAALILAAILLHMGNVMLAALFSFMILDLTHRALARAAPGLLARGGAVVIFAIIATSLSWLLVYFARLALSRMDVILSSIIPQLDLLTSRYNVDLPFENIQELRQTLLQAIRQNAASLTTTSQILTKGFFQIVIGIFAAILCFLDTRPANYKPNLFDYIRREFNERVALFMGSFERVFGAQALISLINSGLTAIYLIAAGIPYVQFLTLTTFILGMLPLIGNVASNTIIVGTALTISPRLAVLSLAFLIFIHKLEYFLNSHIVGSRTDIPMWQVLLGLLVGEAVLGVAGIMLAPAMIHYIREELQRISARAGRQAA